MISVVIPLYNKAPHIERALRSVLNQTFQPSEIIVVDDGSIDESTKNVKAVGSDLIELLRQENKGASAARNRGVDAAKSDYIAFLDADDEWLPNHLEVLRDAIACYPEKGLYSTLHFIYAGGRILSPHSPYKESSEPLSVANYFEKFAIGLSLVNSSTACISRSCFNSAGGFPEGTPQGEDIILWTKAFLGCGMAHVPLRTAIYHRDAINRSVDHRAKEPPGSLVYLANLIREGVLPGQYEESARMLFEKIAFFTAAGMKVSGDTGGLRAIRKLVATQDGLRLRALLWFLTITPTAALNFSRRIRHRCSAPESIKKIIVD